MSDWFVSDLLWVIWACRLLLMNGYLWLGVCDCLWVLCQWESDILYVIGCWYVCWWVSVGDPLWVIIYRWFLMIRCWWLLVRVCLCILFVVIGYRWWLVYKWVWLILSGWLSNSEWLSMAGYWWVVVSDCVWVIRFRSGSQLIGCGWTGADDGLQGTSCMCLIVGDWVKMLNCRRMDACDWLWMIGLRCSTAGDWLYLIDCGWLC